MSRARYLILVLAIGMAGHGADRSAAMAQCDPCGQQNTECQQTQHARCEPCASEWSSPRPIGSASGFYALAASGATVHTFFGDNPIRYARSVDEGATFERPIPLVASGMLHPTGPAVAQGSNVYLVFFRRVRQATDWCCSRDLGDLYIRRSNDGGATWLPEQRLTTAGAAFRYDLAVAGSAVHLVWSDYRNNTWQLYYLRSLDHGATWTIETLLAANPGHVVEINRPQIAAHGKAVHVTWEDSRDNAPPCYSMPNCTEVYYKRSADGGMTWGRDTRLTHDGANASFRPSIAAMGTNTVLVSYQSNRDHNQAAEQQVLRSDDDGMNWTGPTRLTFTRESSEHDTLIGGGSTAHLSWSEDANGGRRHSVHYRATIAGQNAWTRDEPISCPIGGRWSVIADLAVTANYVHAFFTDNARQFFYARRPLNTLSAQ
jgi:hypothetical protein